ncbi:hypothetical protein P9Z24_29590, partial [Bacillus cereus]|nr:hypothetical protein [Bacillus cereus]
MCGIAGWIDWSKDLSHEQVKCTPIVRHSLTIGGAFFMAKFSSKEKIQAVKRYLDGTESGKTIAKSIGVNPSVL